MSAILVTLSGCSFTNCASIEKRSTGLSLCQKVDLLDSVLIIEKQCEGEVTCEMGLFDELEKATGHKSQAHESHYGSSSSYGQGSRTRYVYSGSNACAAAAADIAKWRAALGCTH